MTAPSADLVLVNGVIETLDPGLGRTHALAVSGGRVVAVGEAAASLAPAAPEVVDLGGRYVMPGLLDVHNHHLIAGQMDLFELDAPPTLDLDGFLAVIAEYASGRGPDEWIVGGNWGSGLLPELNTPEALARLDAVTGGRPTLLKDDSKHNRWANSKALQLAAIGDATPNPEGGKILRDAAGRATGVLIEAGGVLVE